MRRIKVYLLGTASSIPTKDRNPQSILIWREGTYFMFDCGEGTQRQMMKAGLGFNRQMRIFVTHIHGDHVLGLPGLLQTMGFLGRDKPLELYGPRGLRTFVECNLRALDVKLTYPLKLRMVKEGTVYEDEEVVVKARKGRHGIANYAYRFEEKPRPGRFNVKRALELGVPKGPLWKRLQEGHEVKIGDRVVKPEEVLGPPRRGLSVGISGDTRAIPRLEEFFRGVDLLIFESTYTTRHEDVAREYLHSTAKEAAELAKNAGVKALIMTHVSNRYREMGEVLEEARCIFENSYVAEDLMSVEVSEEGVVISSSSARTA